MNSLRIIFSLSTALFTGTIVFDARPVYSAEPVYSKDEPLRLIETSPGTQSWMSRAEVQNLAEEGHEAGRCGFFMDVTRYPEPSLSPVLPFQIFGKKEPDQNQIIEPLLENVSSEKLRERVLRLSQFKNRHYESDTGVQSMEWIRDQLRVIAGPRSDITFRMVTHEFKQPSVIATIAGSGPQASEIVIIGGHADSVNWKGGFLDPVKDRPAPGADDNASGTSTIMEAFRVIVQSNVRLNRTLEFMFYAGEEEGLLGSQDIAWHYKDEARPVIAVMQFDMTMFNPLVSPEITMITDHVNADLTAFVERLIETYIHIPYNEEKCGYACSDHASWTRMGYNSVYPFEAPANQYNRRIHTVDDNLDPLDFEFGSHYAKLAVSFGLELAL